MKIVQDYMRCYQMMGFDDVHQKVYNRRARVKRSFKRLKLGLQNNIAECRNRIKQYYKIMISDQIVKTRNRNLIVTPFMVNKLIKLYNGRYYEQVRPSEQNLGRYLSENVPTRKKGSHSEQGKKPVKRT